MEEIVYELFKSLKFDGYIAYIYGLEQQLDYGLLYEAQKKLIEDGYIITKVETPYIHCQKKEALENE